MALPYMTCDVVCLDLWPVHKAHHCWQPVSYKQYQRCARCIHAHFGQKRTHIQTTYMLYEYIQIATWNDTKIKEETIQNMSLARPNGGGPPPIWGQLIATSGTLWGMAPPQRCTAVQCTSSHQLVQKNTSCHGHLSKYFSTNEFLLKILGIQLIYLRSHHQTNTACPKYLCFYWWSISK